MNANYIFLNLCILCQLKFGRFKETDEDVDLLLTLDEVKHHRHPHDMFAINEIKQPTKLKKDEKEEELLIKNPQQESCKYQEMKIRQCDKKVASCSLEVEKLITQSKVDQEVISSLKKNFLNNSNSVDVHLFYMRLLRKFWGYLNMEKAESLLRRGNEAVINRLVVSVTAADVAAFKQLFSGKETYQQVDAFFSQNIKVEEIEEGENIIDALWRILCIFFENMKSFEMWLLILWTLMIALFVWSYYCFLKNIQREFHWGRLLIMFFILAFIISCIFHWKHMIKVKESKRQSYLVEKEKGKRCIENEGLWSNFQIYIFGGKSECEKYYKNLMVSAEDEISPVMVISETASSLFFLPLEKLGNSVGIFISNFYGNIPLFYHLSGTILLVVLFSIIMFGWFGYGIYFPFWLGGIRPAKREHDVKKIEEIIKENHLKFSAENKALMEETKAMVTKVSNISLSEGQEPGSRVYLDSVIESTTSLINRRIEELMDKKLAMTIDTLREKRNVAKPLQLTKGDGNDLEIKLTASSSPSVEKIKVSPLKTPPSPECEFRIWRRDLEKEEDSVSEKSICRSSYSDLLDSVELVEETSILRDSFTSEPENEMDSTRSDPELCSCENMESEIK